MKQNLHLPGKPLTVIAKRNPATKRLTEGIKGYSEDDLPKIEDKVKRALSGTKDYHYQFRNRCRS